MKKGFDGAQPDKGTCCHAERVFTRNHSWSTFLKQNLVVKKSFEKTSTKLSLTMALNVTLSVFFGRKTLVEA